MTSAVCQEAKRPARRSSRHAHIASLDGLRAISIVLVLEGHLAGTRGFHYIDLGLAHFGVLVFFVISGFLITTLLTREYQSNGRISLKLFYARRAIRIFPAAYAYMAVLSLLWLSGVVHLRTSDFWHAITYTVNFEPGHAWQIGHLWSLSVEEQFYLLWPFAFMSLRPRKATWAAVAVLFVAIVARGANRVFLVGTPFHDLPMFPMVADSLAMGCLLARLRGHLESQAWYRRLLAPGPSLLILAVVLLINGLQGYTVASVLGMAFINLGIAILIHRCVYHSDDTLGRVLNHKSVAFVGVLSYSLYLWQQVFVNRSSGAWMNAFPQNLVLAIAAALASYYFIEKPLLGLRQRLRLESSVPARPQILAHESVQPLETFSHI